MCWNKGRLCWKIAKFFISVTLKRWSGHKFWTLLRTHTTKVKLNYNCSKGSETVPIVLLANKARGKEELWKVKGETWLKMNCRKAAEEKVEPSHWIGFVEFCNCSAALRKNFREAENLTVWAAKFEGDVGRSAREMCSATWHLDTKPLFAAGL